MAQAQSVTVLPRPLHLPSRLGVGGRHFTALQAGQNPPGLQSDAKRWPRHGLRATRGLVQHQRSPPRRPRGDCPELLDSRRRLVHALKCGSTTTPGEEQLATPSADRRFAVFSNQRSSWRWAAAVALASWRAPAAARGRLKAYARGRSELPHGRSPADVMDTHGLRRFSARLPAPSIWREGPSAGSTRN